ncbi:MAG TPA: hypothetical protein ENK66_03085 [Arcobacter sp.]|nr:hypothetical protein [Arcobacter sp.]
MLIVDKIKQYSVMVKCDEKVAGSGILVKSIDNQCYLFTAKHLFKKGKDKSHKKVKQFNLEKNLNKISIYRESFEKEIFVDELLYFENDLDLIVFSLKEEPNIQHLPIIKVLKNDHQIQDYHFYGYPIGAKDISENHTGNYDKAIYSQSNEEERNIFRLSSQKNIDTDAVSGYSGSGIFVEETTEQSNEEDVPTSIIYLVGILIRAKNGLSYYEGIDLSNVIDDINRKAHLNIPTIEDAIDVQFTKNIKNRILQRNQEDIFIQAFKKLDNEENKNILKEFLDNNENNLTEMTKKLADFYLLGGMAYKDDGHDESAKKYFRLATKFNPKYKRYEKDYQGKNNQIDSFKDEENEESRNYYHEGIIAFQYNKYDEAKQAFLKYLKSETLDFLEKIEIHKYLSKIYLKEENYVEAEIEASQALDKYIEVEKESNQAEKYTFEKAELCYELFQICTKGKMECSLGWIKRGLKYIGQKTEDDDEEILFIRRKLEIEDKKAGKEDYIKSMTPTLIELVQRYPEEYIEDFITEYENNRESESKNYKKISEKVEGLKQCIDEIKNHNTSEEKNKKDSINPNNPLKD